MDANNPLIAISNRAIFPPAFDNNPFSYGFALFSLTIMAALSLTHLVRVVRAIDPKRDGWLMPITVGRLINICFFTAFVMVTFPDIVTLILWNEVSAKVMENIWATDRFFDGLTLIPFLVGTTLMLKSHNALVWQMLKTPQPITSSDVGYNLDPLWRQWVMIALIALISAGIALGKLF